MNAGRIRNVKLVCYVSASIYEKSVSETRMKNDFRFPNV